MHSAPLSIGNKRANLDTDTDIGVHTVTLSGAESGSVTAQFDVVAGSLLATGVRLTPWV
ncbi:hypothetical protein [Microbacterium amylolyticum]|uniref:Uncharacterized protein n=1 Tax=Microbacterium amylolyticum TaxID=936337 RepID=A0ABS4ZHH4_9MICO|nr:hypothetical protein [Microbacterium amylolyticum]MBP2436735.1 hypothetical protein [Microbacterium amylolyticum]